MSGFTNDVLGARGIISPEVELLTKPFAPDDLLTRVREILAAPIGQLDGRGEVA